LDHLHHRPVRTMTHLVVRRDGTTLVEILAALAVAGILAATLVRALDRAGRLHAGTTALVEQTVQLHAATSIIRETTTELSTGSGDLQSVAPAAVIISGAVGSAIACAQSGSTLDLPPDRLASNQRLAFWNTSPQAGDSVAWYDEGANPGPSDDGWRRHEVLSATWLVGACQSTVFTSPADAGRGGWRLDLGGLGSPVPPGAILRLTRPQRLSVYRSATSWMLGYAEWDASRNQWHIVQPVAGPIDQPGPAGFMALLDSLGAPTTTNGSSAALSIRIGSTTATPLRIDGRTRGPRVDSSAAAVTMRNRQ
jgi:hypothetical protein